MTNKEFWASCVLALLKKSKDTSLITAKADTLTEMYRDFDERFNQRAPISYVTHSGVVRIPEHVLKELGIPSGGGIVFLSSEKKGHVEIVSNDMVSSLLGWDKEKEEDG